MREGGKGLRRLGFAALFMFAASAATAQTQELAIGQRNLACGSPTSLNDGWPTATPESVGLDGSRLCGIAAKLAATNANVIVRKYALLNATPKKRRSIATHPSVNCQTPVRACLLCAY